MLSRLVSQILVPAALVAVPFSSFGRGEERAAGLEPKQIESLAAAAQAYETARNLPDLTKAEAERKEALDAFTSAATAIAEARGLSSLLLEPDLLQQVFRSLSDPTANVKPGVSKETAEMQLEGTNHEREYAVQMPRGYRTDEASPLVLAFPPSGTAPSKYLGDAWNKGKARESLLVVCITRERPLDLDSFQDKLNVFAPFRDALECYAVDYDRILLDAAGDGAEDAIDLARRYPGRFAGLVLRSPTGKLPSIAALVNLPVLVVETEGKRAGEAVQAAAENLAKSSPAPGSQVLLSKSKGPAFDVETQDAVTDWVDARRRTISYAEHLVYEMLEFERMGWIEPTNMEEGKIILKEKRPRIEATLDRANNRIDVQSEFVYAYRVYLSPRLLDLGKEIEIRTNGKTSFRGTLQPSLENVLEFQFNNRDPAAIYSAWKDIEISGGEE